MDLLFVLKCVHNCFIGRKPKKEKGNRMARISTGISKKANRENLAALKLCYVWRDQFGIGVKMDEEFAWVVSDGKFGTKPASWGQAMTVPAQIVIAEPTINTFKVALYLIKRDKLVA